jgi:hypothetical protein
VVNTDPFGYIGDPPPTGPSGPTPDGAKGAWWVMGAAVLSIVPGQMIGGFAVGAPVAVAFVGAVAVGLWDDFAARRKAVDTEPVGPDANPVPVTADSWTAARDRFHRLRGEYADYECDPMQVLRLPALADPTVPSTARFVAAFADAQGLETDRFPDPGHAREFVDAVGLAETAWRAARAAARRIRLAGLDPDERAAVGRAITLLTTAAGSDNEAERLLAYSRARAELARLERAGVLRLPLPSRAALAEDARGELLPP